MTEQGEDDVAKLNAMGLRFTVHAADGRIIAALADGRKAVDLVCEASGGGELRKDGWSEYACNGADLRYPKPYSATPNDT